MGNDIEILERVTRWKDIGSTYTYDEIEAIENVLTRLKILKDKENKLIEVTNLYLNSVPKSKIKVIRDKAECMDYYCLNDVIDDLNKLLGDE